jgi:hypothetical protein
VRPNAAAMLELLDQVLGVVRTTPQDLSWQSRYSDENELVDDLTDHAARIRQHDWSRLSELRFLFLPTGPLCEIAAGSGWLATYTMLGNRFDQLVEQR